MLKRPDAGPGCAWMERLDSMVPAPGPVDPEKQRRFRRLMIGFWIIWLAILLLANGPNWFVPSAGPLRTYESPIRIAGYPLFAYGQNPRGVIAVGAFPVGLIAIGGLALGGIAIGGLAAGGIALSGVSLGIFSIGGLAVGWWSFGGGAIGNYAFGGLAIGNYAYAGGGVALGRYAASGRQKEKLIG